MQNESKNTAMSGGEVKQKERYTFAPQDGVEAIAFDAESREEAEVKYKEYVKSLNK